MRQATRLPAALAQSGNARETVEASIEAQDALDALLLHDGDVQRVSSRQTAMTHHDVLGSLGGGAVDRQHLVDDVQERIECRLNRIAPIDRDIAVQDLLQNFCVRYEALTAADEFFERALRVDLMRMRRANQVHRHIGIDEDHSRRP